jgi:quinol monooxygenase YgiN
LKITLPENKNYIMLTRIVKLTFQEEKLADFMQVFEESKSAIRAFPGCQRMSLARKLDTSNVLFTISLWESPEALEQYRQSALFQTTWAKTKVLFAEKAEAWSVELIDVAATSVADGV